MISPNAPVRQIWISALATSFKLDWSENARGFVLTKTGEGLKALATRLINQQLGRRSGKSKLAGTSAAGLLRLGRHRQYEGCVEPSEDKAARDAQSNSAHGANAVA